MSRETGIQEEKTSRRIQVLERETWQGYCLPFHYVSRHYYDLEIRHTDQGLSVSFCKKAFETPFEKLDIDSDQLFQPWWEDVKAWGILENGRLVAAIETAVEEWSNRLRVTELWIDVAYRRQGIGTALMDIALQRAREEKRRALILETQSCNEAAIAFYLAYGFSLVGFDLCAYENNDVARREVRMELGILLEP
ncbi:MAG: GNAT family N-acetyltransferase [Bacillota bacterium]|nr:GNAT family N-acetyltransferase [Bacillota bacterium]